MEITVKAMVRKECPRLCWFSEDKVGLRTVEKRTFQIDENDFAREFMLVDMAGQSPEIIGKNLTEIITSTDISDKDGRIMSYYIASLYGDITEKGLDVIQIDVNGWSYLRYSNLGYWCAWIRTEKLDENDCSTYGRRDFDAIFDNYKWYSNDEEDNKIYD